MTFDSDKEKHADTPVRELTAKEEEFVRQWALTGNKSEAYRQAYDAECMCPEAICVEACRLSKSPKISLRFTELNKNAADLVGITKARVLNRHADIAFSETDDKYSAKDVKGALDSISKMCSFNEAEKIEHSGNAAPLGPPILNFITPAPVDLDEYIKERTEKESKEKEDDGE